MFFEPFIFLIIGHSSNLITNTNNSHQDQQVLFASSNNDLTDMIPLDFGRICLNDSATTIGFVKSEDVEDIQKLADDTFDVLKKLQNPQSDPEIEWQFQSKIFDNAEDLDAYQQDYKNMVSDNKLCMAIQFDSFTDENYQVSIRYGVKYLPEDFDNQKQYTLGLYDMKIFDDWINSDFVNVMSAVTEVITKQQEQASKFKINLLPSWTPDFQQNTNIEMQTAFISIGMTMFCGLPQLIIYLSQESNEDQIQSLSSSMGLKKSSIIAARMILLYIVMIAGGIPFFTAIKLMNIFPHSNIWLQVIVFFLVCQGTVLTLSFFSEVAGPKAALAYFVTFALKIFILDMIFIVNPYPPYLAYPFTLLLPVSAQNLFLRQGLIFEQLFPDKGLDFENLNTTWGDINTLNILLILIANNVLATLGISISAMIEKRNEKNFLAQPNSGQSNEGSDVEKGSILLKAEQQLVEKGHYEAVKNTYDDSMHQGQMEDQILRIDQLTKSFQKHGSKSKDDIFKAVDNLSLSLFKNQILCLLGHNGAGKTTTMQMISGFMTKTSGSASVFGIEIFNQREEMKQYIGICPQHDVLSEKLTVLQNLHYFAAIRSLSLQQTDEFIKKYLPQVSLDIKKDAIVKTLSGGQKRKLQLLISMLGQTRIILLDEPSSGMDPTSRRDTWSFIQELKKDRFIILTTHYMDEADELGDRIAIMSKGSLKTCGSSLFLKKKYDLGTILEITQENKSYEMTELMELINEIVKKRASEQQIQGVSTISGSFDEASNLFVIKLPNIMAEFFPEIFAKLDDQQTKKDLNIRDYNVRVTSLEEVFNTIGEQEQSLDEQNASLQRESDNNLQAQGIQQNFETKSWFFMVKIVLKLRLMIVKRKYIFIAVILMMGLNTALNYITIGSQAQKHNPRVLTPKGVYKDTEFTVGLGMQQDISGFTLNGYEIVEIESQMYPDDVNKTIATFSEASFDNQFSQNGQIFVNEYSANMIDIYTFTNLQIGANLNLMASAAFQQVVRLQNPNLKLTFVNNPLSQSQLQAQASTNPINAISFGAWPFVRIVGAIILPIYFLERNKGIDRQLIMAGVKRSQLLISNLLIEIFLNILGMAVWYLATLFSHLDGIWLAFLVFAISQAIFNQAFYLYFKTMLFFQMSGIPQIVFITAVATLGINAPTMMSVLIPVEILISHCPIFGVLLAQVKLIWLPYFYAEDGTTSDLDPWGWSGCLPEIIGMGSSSMICIILILIDIYNCCVSKKVQDRKEIVSQFNGMIEDTKVVAESERVQKLSPSAEQLIVSNISKTFQTGKNETFTAVESVSFSFKKGDRFILLGLNGAGKSTTFKMLTAEERPSSGSIKINGMDINEIHDNTELMRNVIGYCPQTNPIWDFLTVYETLYMLAQIRGYPRNGIESFVKIIMTKFRIEIYGNTQAGNLSGGNKRKLVTAMAMMGNPSIILLDESSAGVDPYSRRHLWKTIREESENSTLVVTTHSMEEAEALGTKMAIMVSGAFKCFGTSQEIKDTYGEGFHIQLKIDYDQINKSQNQIEKQETFAKFDDLIKFLHDVLKRKLADNGVDQTMAEQFMLKGILDEFLPQFEDDQDIASFKGAGKIVHLVLQIMLISQSFVEDFGIPVLQAYTNNTLQLRLKNPKNLSIGFVFGFIHKLTRSLPIKEFDATETTLEQVFNSFAKEQILGNKKASRSSIRSLKTLKKQKSL